jgi:hypothetical protein
LGAVEVAVCNLLPSLSPKPGGAELGIEEEITAAAGNQQAAQHQGIAEQTELHVLLPERLNGGNDSVIFAAAAREVKGKRSWRE